MFKKPLADLKTSAPLRSSDRRKLKQRVIDSYTLPAEIGELLVPDGLLSQKFSTHVEDHGVVYLSQAGDPLWFTIGKGSDDLIPTVYTLWKHPTLLPFLSTPAAVVPKLIGGADLMIPGVIQHTTVLHPDQLVSVTQYHPANKIGPPLAVGRMAVSSGQLSVGGEERKGKAVLVLHTWKDWLWEMGSSKKMEVLEPREVQVGGEGKGDGDMTEQQGNESDDDNDVQGGGGAGKDSETAQIENAEGHGREADAPATQPPPVSDQRGESGQDPKATPVSNLTAEDISSCLRNALLQALSTTLKSLPQSSFPMSASTFWTTYVLPARPAHALGTYGLADVSTVDIKHSTHKSVKVFLKACVKEGLIKLKESKGDVSITGVFPNHPAVTTHRPHKTLGSIEAKREKAEERERKEKEAEEKKKGEIQVTELWKPIGQSVPFFVSAGKSTSELYTLTEIRDIFNAYVIEKKLINAREQQYINIGEDLSLSAAVSIKTEDTPEFLKREETIKRIKDNMQSWHRLGVEGGDVVIKKGTVKPISVIVKVRQGRKAATLVTGFEPFFLRADELAEELRKVCASSTSVTQLPGKASTDMEVMVQGKQIKAVTDFLVSKGVSKKWIESADMTADKKKK